ncbi:hypothetical protein KW94_17900 [Clostridioides difficile]|uniref:TetR/AcrR family transcriptional regulator n=1 Tax=unclassified Clostridioides TaxID=2635829 RepID=UPI0006BBD2AE|nr:hypothetical protein KW94_17900 [Clostridioides difficile]NJI81317.1 hypothetical protein [Clostridioides difficile]
MKKERRDIRKSRESIKQAFIKLSMHNDVSKITVNKILELADISRGTFYAHFKDIYDVQEQVEEELLNKCLCTMKEYDIYDIVENPYPQILKVVIFFQEHADTIRNLSCNGKNASFFYKYKEILKKGIQESNHTIEDKETVNILDAFIVGGIVDSCLEMLSMEYVINNSKTPEKTAKTISTFISQGIYGLKNKI